MDECLGRVLLVDDDELCLNTTSRLLQTHGYRCDRDSHITSAIDTLCRLPYDLLIANIGMSNVQEEAFAQHLARLTDCLPVIFTTENPQLLSKTQILPIPVIGHLIKPFEPGDLLVLVKQAMRYTQTCHVMRDAHERWQQLSDDVKQIERLAKIAPMGRASLPVNTLFKLELANIAGTLIDLGRLSDSVSMEIDENHTRHVIELPQSFKLLNAVRETIIVLEGTKTAFKSKALGNLRQKLMKLLEDIPNG